MSRRAYKLADPRARVTDPVTSHAAASDAKAFSRAHARVVDTVLEYARGEALAVEEVVRRGVHRSAVRREAAAEERAPRRGAVL